jgi:rhodanese-related sulfurtransferase
MTDAHIDALLAEAREALGPRPGPEQAAAEQAEGALLVDTRPSELRRVDGEIPGAVIVDRNKLEWRLDPSSPWSIDQIERADQRVIVICDEGYASTLAAVTLRRLGLSSATDLDGGFQAWAAAGLPVERRARPGSWISGRPAV